MRLNSTYLSMHFLLLTSVLLLQPSLWYNSPAKMASSPASITPESVSTGERNTDVEPDNPSYDGPASSALREKCEHSDSMCGGSLATNVALNGQHSPTPSMCSESSSSRCTNSQHPLAPVVPPPGQDALVRSALLSVNVCDSAGPSMEYNGHDPLVRSSSKGQESGVSRPALRNSASPSMYKGQHSVAPSMAPESYGALAPSRAHGNSSSTDAQYVACQVQAPSMVPQLCAARSMAPELGAPRSMAPHLSAARRMAPHLRGKMVSQLCAARSMAPDFGAPISMAPHLSASRSMAPHLRGNMPKVPENNTMPEANNYSSTATVVPMIFEPPSCSPSPKDNGSVTSSKECIPTSSVQQGPDCPANSATKLQSTPELSMLLEKYIFVLITGCLLSLYSLKLLNGSVQSQQQNVEQARTSPG